MKARVTADKAIHLSAAFQLAGFRQVIGTPWEIEDEISARVAAACYASLGDSPAGVLDTGTAARSLHDAVRAERDTLVRTPSLWAAYLHAGA